jgi:DNA (cytosine-5)-methyltransferase 1
MKVAEFFTGFGAGRVAADMLGMDTVVACEIDPYARKVYDRLHGATDWLTDITKINPKELPDFALLTGGFPCQPFSKAGSGEGFADARGTLFFHLAEIIREKRPSAFVLENVKNLLTHDDRHTFLTICHILREMGYQLKTEVLDSSPWVPQKRERLFIVGILQDEPFSVFERITPPSIPVRLWEILEEDPDDEFTLGDRTWEFLQEHRAKHEAAGNGFGYDLIRLPIRCQVTRTLTRRYYKDGSEILIEQAGKNPRRLTPLECHRLMGFPKSLEYHWEDAPVSKTRAYMGFGNSIVASMFTDLLRGVTEWM